MTHSIDAPLPLAHQWAGLMPFDQYSVANRNGGLFAAAAAALSCAPKRGRDSIQGNARATPAPRKK